MTLIVIVWLVLAILAAVAASSMLGFTFHASLALAQDALVYVLVIAWLALALAVVSHRWLLGVVAVGASMS